MRLSIILLFLFSCGYETPVEKAIEDGADRAADSDYIIRHETYKCLTEDYPIKCLETIESNKKYKFLREKIEKEPRICEYKRDICVYANER